MLPSSRVAEGLPLLGKLVSLRQFGATDITDAYLGWLNDPEVVRYSNQRFVRHSSDSAQRYLASFAGTANLFLSMRRRDTDAAIGTMTAYVSVPHGTVDLGIMVGDRAVWGRGYGQDAWSTMVEWFASQSRIRKVTAGTLACNRAMIRLTQKAGMQHEATRAQQEIVAGQPEDVQYYARFTGR